MSDNDNGSGKPNFPSQSQFDEAAHVLQCDPNVIRAFAKVEAGSNGAFLPSGKPVILFEAHLFYRFTDGAYAGLRMPSISAAWGVLSRPSQVPGSYGPYGVQHARLEVAAAVARDEALRATSWGLFQVLGNNHTVCGWPRLLEFVDAMYESVDRHLQAFVGFVSANHSLAQAVRAQNWAAMARLYNGPNYHVNQYDIRIAKAYQELMAS